MYANNKKIDAVLAKALRVENWWNEKCNSLSTLYEFVRHSVRRYIKMVVWNLKDFYGKPTGELCWTKDRKCRTATNSNAGFTVADCYCYQNEKASHSNKSKVESCKGDKEERRNGGCWGKASNTKKVQMFQGPSSGRSTSSWFQTGLTNKTPENGSKYLKHCKAKLNSDAIVIKKRCNLSYAEILWKVNPMWPRWQCYKN